MPYHLPELLDYPITHAFSTKEDGNMSFKWGEEKIVKQNRANFFTELKINPLFCVTSELIHGDKIIRVTKKDAGHGVLNNDYQIQADGLITNELGLNLFQVVADCLPILFYDPANKAIGLAHAGWRGTSQNIAGKTIAALVHEFKTKPADLIVGLGPSIHKCCFSYPEAKQESMPDWQPFINKQVDKQTHVNNVGYNLWQLTSAGVEQENIFMSEFCTAHSGKFFSHYVDIKNKTPETRFVALIGLPPDN